MALQGEGKKREEPRRVAYKEERREVAEERTHLALPHI